LAGRLGAVFNLGIVAAALVASGGVYYYAVYEPRRDAALGYKGAPAKCALLPNPSLICDLMSRAALRFAKPCRNTCR